MTGASCTVTSSPRTSSSTGRARSKSPTSAWPKSSRARLPWKLATEGASEAGASLTQAGRVVGTPQYMAPEQVTHPLEVDHRADIYSLGVVFYQMLTGELPGKPIEVPSRKVQVDVRLDEVVLHALEKEPERRYQQASQVKTAVETIAANAAKSESQSPKAETDQSLPAAQRRQRLLLPNRRAATFRNAADSCWPASSSCCHQSSLFGSPYSDFKPSAWTWLSGRMPGCWWGFSGLPVATALGTLLAAVPLGRAAERLGMTPRPQRWSGLAIASVAALCVGLPLAGAAVARWEIFLQGAYWYPLKRIILQGDYGVP